MCSSAPPPPPPTPDYTGAAVATAQGDEQAAATAAMANRVNQITPQGDLTYTAPSNPNQPWTVTQTYTPAEQQLFNQNNAISGGLLSLGSTALGQISNNMVSPITAGDLPTSMVNPGRTGYQAYMAQVQPDLDQAKEVAESQMAQQGITQGSTAWQNEERALGVNQNQAENQAEQTGFTQGQSAQQQALQIQTALQDQPINEVDALRSGSQVSNPSFTAVPQQQTTTGPNYLGATTAAGQYDLGTYNAQLATANADTGALGQIGAAAAGKFL
jgi:hypothetical protein